MAFPPPQIPIALTIAGSDSGGGAGIQADLKTFTTLGVFGTSAITAITAQNPDGVSAIQAIDPEIVAAQVRQVAGFFPVRAIKIGMLHSAETVSAVAEVLEQVLPSLREELEHVPVVIDPVMVATSGARLLQDNAVDALCERLLPLASVITPNMDEAALLSGLPVETAEHLEPAAAAIGKRLGVPVLVKGGHLQGSEEAVDVLWAEGKTEFFGAPFLLQVNPHGTGCTLSSAIAVYLLRGYPLPDAVSEAKHYLHKALSESLPAGSRLTLNHAHTPLPLEVLA